MTEEPFEETASSVLVKYHRFVYWLAYRSIPFPELAEDVAQQTFVDFLDNTDKWDLKKNPRSLLMTMVQRRARSIWRERVKLLPESLQKIGMYVQRELNEDNTEGEEHLASLRSCLQKLPDGGRQLIMRHYFDGIPTKQMAAELQKSNDSVRKAIYRVQEKLRLCIEQTLKAKKYHGGL